MGNTSSIPAFFILSLVPKSRAESPCPIMRYCHNTFIRLIPCIGEPLNSSVSAGQRVFSPSCAAQKMGKISAFSYCTIGAKDPPKPAVLIVRCCLNMKIIKRRVSMIFHSENYGCQIGTGACRNPCPVQIHPGGFSAALKN